MIDGRPPRCERMTGLAPRGGNEQGSRGGEDSLDIGANKLIEAIIKLLKINLADPEFGQFVTTASLRAVTNGLTREQVEHIVGLIWEVEFAGGERNLLRAEIFRLVARESTPSSSVPEVTDRRGFAQRVLVLATAVLAATGVAPVGVLILGDPVVKATIAAAITSATTSLMVEGAEQVADGLAAFHTEEAPDDRPASGPSNSEPGGVTLTKIPVRAGLDPDERPATPITHVAGAPPSPVDRTGESPSLPSGPQPPGPVASG